MPTQKPFKKDEFKPKESLLREDVAVDLSVTLGTFLDYERFYANIKCGEILPQI